MDDIRKGRAHYVLEHVESHLTQLSIKDDLIDCPCTFLDILFQTSYLDYVAKCSVKQNGLMKKLLIFKTEL